MRLRGAPIAAGLGCAVLGVVVHAVAAAAHRRGVYCACGYVYINEMVPTNTVDTLRGGRKVGPRHKYCRGKT